MVVISSPSLKKKSLCHIGECFSSVLLLHGDIREDGVLLCDGSQFFKELGEDHGGVNLRPVGRDHDLGLDGSDLHVLSSNLRI